jgi:hypothetical protein
MIVFGGIVSIARADGQQPGATAGGGPAPGAVAAPANACSFPCCDQSCTCQPAGGLANATCDSAHCGTCDGGNVCHSTDPDCGGWGATVFTTVNAFKGPTDVDGLNGDFGASAGANLGFALVRELGLGVQAGTSVTGSDFKGTFYTGPRAREQQFTTFGFFRSADRDGGWNGGVVYDFLDDDYYVDFHFGQWRGELGYQFQSSTDIGVSFTVPSFGTNVLLQNPPAVGGFSQNRFQPFSQINAFWRHTWPSQTVTEFRLGVPDSSDVGELIFGASAACPLNCRTSLIGGFTYVLPSVPGGNADVPGGTLGRSGEVWSLYTGIAFTLGGGERDCGRSRFAPLIPVADQGSFGITRVR